MVYNNFNVIIDSWCLLVPLFLFAWLPLFGISAVDLCNLPTPKTSRIKGVAIFFFPAVFNLAVLKVSSNIIQRFNVCMNENATIPTCSMACLFSQVPAHRRFLLRMLLLPCVLGEFRTQERGDEAAKQIIGLPDTWPELAGGNSNMSLNFHPKIWWRWTHFETSKLKTIFPKNYPFYSTGLKPSTQLGWKFREKCGLYGPTSRTCWMFKLPHLQCMFLVSLISMGRSWKPNALWDFQSFANIQGLVIGPSTTLFCNSFLWFLVVSFPRGKTWNDRIDDDWWWLMVYYHRYSFHFFVAPFWSIAEQQVTPGTHHQWHWIGGWLCRRVGSGLWYHLAADLLGARSKDALRTSGYHEQTVSWRIDVCFDDFWCGFG